MLEKEVLQHRIQQLLYFVMSWNFCCLKLNRLMLIILKKKCVYSKENPYLFGYSREILKKMLLRIISYHFLMNLPQHAKPLNPFVDRLAQELELLLMYYIVN